MSFLRKRRNGKALIPEGMGTSYNGPYGEAPPKSGTFLSFQVYKRVVISLVEVYERVGKTVISVCKKAQKGQQMHFMAPKKSIKCSGFVIYAYFKDIAFTAVKRVA